MPEGDDTTGLLAEVRAEFEIYAGTVLEGRRMVDLVDELLREHAHPDYETVMVPNEGPSRSFDGVEGFREAMTDWLSPWEQFRFEIEELIPADDMLVLLVRQIGRTRHGGVEIATESATIWWVQDELIRRATFYLDRDAARKAAGIALT